ncbi:diaminopimelate decarboxylase [Cellulomonas chitinilytica]|uniref:Diaminopimelate decarboxylase n=1 Tax=Cellulomonas chitinilytica TaxID=398759 RepID=A0A919U165_9CELL|nr:hypothetical protein [Cellulomonas chitinilytica]GIG21081.1 diaminopimelate decarboxylase [Cellulomonas chitinilytica]
MPPTGAEGERRAAVLPADAHETTHPSRPLPVDVVPHLDPAATPLRVYLPSVGRAHVARVGRAVSGAAVDGVRVRAAYSIKTNPDPRLLAAVRDDGFHVEAISQSEVEHAVAAGFAPHRIVLNGPAKWWPAPVTPGPFGAVFCDSVEELRETADRPHGGAPVAGVVGVRVRPPGVTSRFGVELHDPSVLDAVVGSLSRLRPDVRLGLHVHVPPRDVGAPRWWELVDGVVRAAAELESRSGRAVRCLDLGGGWEPADLLDGMLPRLRRTLGGVRRRLERLDEVLLEPGRAVAQPLVALVTRVLAVRSAAAWTDVVVDASIADVPEIGRTAHDWWLARPGHRVPVLAGGGGRVLGRTCMETDVLHDRLRVPDGTRAGDVLVITDVGAYDTSKSYRFGRGDARRPVDVTEV